jgi:adenylate cyclase
VSWSQVRRRLVATTAIGVVVAAVCAWGFAADRLDGAQNLWEGSLQPGLTDSDAVVIVGIDRASLAAFGAWPWPRDLQAQLLATIGAGRPKVVLYDVLMDESRDGDDALVEAMEMTPTVLPTALTLDHRSVPATIVDAVVPADPLAAAAAGVGFANVKHAGDTGVVRTLPLYALDAHGIAQPSIAVTAVAVADGASGPLTERPGGVQVGARFVPLDDAELLINWSANLIKDDSAEADSAEDAFFPAMDVLGGTVSADEFRDRVVVVGVTEPTLGDQHLVPIDRSGNTSGVVVLANAANTILSNGYLDRPSTAWQLGVIVAAALLAAAMFAWLHVVPALLAALAEVAAIVGLAARSFHADGTLWNVVWPVLAVSLVAAAGTVYRYLFESRHRRRAWRLFSTYVPVEVVRELEDPARLQAAVSGVRCDVTVVFADLRGSTALSGALPPARVRDLLEAYYDYSVAIIQRHRGTVMQFVGDEVFAVFGAPVAEETAADEALRCALALQGEIAALDDRLTRAGLPLARFGVGVHRGPVVAAHVGTENRRQYAVVGEAVNIGGRLCDCADAGEIVVSKQAWTSIGPELQRRFVAGGAVELKGVRVPVSVYRAVRASPAPGRADPITAAGSNGDRHDQPIDTVSGPLRARGRETDVAGGQSLGRDE